MDNKDEEFGQELVDVVRPQSTNELEDWTQMDQKEDNEMSDTVTTTTAHAAESSHQNTFVATSIQPTTRTTSLTPAKEESTTTTTPTGNNDFPILGLPRTQVIAPTPIPAASAAALNKPATTTAAEDEALLLPPPSPPTPVPESTVTTDDLPLLETEQQQHPLDTQQQPDVPLAESTVQQTPDVLTADPTFTADSQMNDGTSNNNKRTSVAATMAQSILGDRLEDFTEKLAFIKKNIIMSLEDEETMDEEDRVLKPSFSETNRRR